MTNFYRSTGVVRLERFEVLDDSDAAPLLSYSGSDLDRRVAQPGAEPSVRYGRSISGGMRAIVYVWATLQKGTAPVSLRHRLVFQKDDGTEQSVDGARTRVRTATPLVLRAPLRGGNWLVHNGPGNHHSPHWGSQLALNGRVTIPQRFAVDFIGLDASGNAVRGDFRKSANEDWVGFGAEVVAAADGIVRDMRDGAPDNTPLVEPPPPAAVNLQAIGGNYVVLEVRSNTFVHYIHLQRNSVAVKTGQQVRRGQVIGRVGNSGNTNGPHLHFHVSDASRFEDSEGLPFVFDSFDLLGETAAERAIGADSAAIGPSFSPEARRLQLPLHGAVVRFR